MQHLSAEFVIYDLQQHHIHPGGDERGEPFFRFLVLLCPRMCKEAERAAI